MDEQKDKKRIQDLINTVMRVAEGDYSVQNEISENNDLLDALAMGFNMMIDDLREKMDLKKQNERFRKINQELEKARQKAQESDRLKSAFLANMSHEIRSPLNAIMGFTTLMERKRLSQHRHDEYIQYIKNAGSQLLSLINDIIDVSKIESNQLKLHIDEIKLKDLLHEVYEIIIQDDRLKINKNLILDFQLDTQKGCMVKTDGTRFKQILINLLHNALKFTEEGTVTLKHRYVKKGKEDFVEICVRDTGIGIPEELQEVIFDRFHQGHADYFKEGTGLGLSITKGLTELLKGKISLKSTVGQGSEFCVRFKCSFQSDKKISLKPSGKVLEESLNLSKFLIYVAEDRHESYIFIKHLLQPFKARIEHAANGIELLNLVESRVPDLILLDMHMPEMDGYEAIRELRKRKINIPVIAQTAFAMEDEQMQITKSGCDGYVSKPINPRELLDQLKAHLKLNKPPSNSLNTGS